MPEDKVEGERDVEVQRHSTDRLAAIEHGIKGILHSSKTRKVHTLVRRRAVDRITVAIDYFQELPQLLDRKLKAFIGEVSDAFVEYLEIHKHRYLQDAGRRKEDVLPLPRAVCYILYTFCKVRGQNIITQLLHNEPRYLEPMFEAFLLWNPWITKSRGPIPFDEDICTWQERYVMLIWLCHLLLVPNDLTNVFPEEFGDELTMPPLLMPVPRSLPAISRRLIQTATFFLDKAGPERGPAVKLLLRLTLRTDMSRANLDQWMIPWTVSLVEEVDLAQTSDVFFAHSALSFMGDFLKTADERTLICNFSSVWKLAQTTLNDEQCQSALFATGGIGALTVKLYRELGSVAYPIRWGDQEDILQAVISFLLSMLADESTTVRFKASKALGVVSSQIGQDLAEEVLDQILSDLSEDFNEIDQSSISAHDQQYKKTPLTHQNATSDEQYLPPKVQLAIETPDIDYQMSNANLWHGYVLAIAHLLFRRAVPVTSLSRIASVLTKAMSFNQQNIQGARVGENVRDAAIFSVWALSRKYKTNETFSPDHSFMHDLSFQLVSLACFDPAGNIRRGASAALQEMVGRHPNKIKEGLGLVRIVDYYAVASRTNAMLKVASEVLRLLNDDQTALLLFLGLKGWRGFQSRDVADRRLAAQSIGYLSVASLNTFNQFTFFWQAAYAASNGEAVLHSSLLMALGAMLDTIHGMWQSHDNDRRMHDILSKDRTRIEARTSDAVASGSLPMDWKIPIAALKSLQGEGALSSGADSGSMQEAVCLFVQSFASIAGYSHRNLPFYIPLPSEEEVKEQIRDVERCLLSSDSAVQRVCAGALHALLCLASSGLLQNTVHRWLQYLGNPEARKLQKVICLTESIGLMFHLFEAPSRQSVVSYIDCRNATLNMINQLLSEPWEEIRCAALRAATEGPIKCNITNAALFSAIENSLTDFSIDHQSRDVGSSVRLEAITATELLLQTPSDNLLDSQARQRLIILLCALAVEYYDKIRVEATSCLRRNWQAFGLFSFTYP
ncbi:uncharacterized protein KY384_007528 [Bacidia gigantensis]|uniref:uncharacterized protein n=1 Tax=Bacidia gigantensis TaxID=2732470 RepID=UPI001D04D3CD|nr:uncharacterized protein KY384_007528 [Bacidia gigantensis]KAG8527376.1 hypothetical protein KY384_007528 [Bacidia gigantensis]